MLERGERVSDVAETVGFDNFTYFSTIFKKYTGVSPNQYCKKQRIRFGSLFFESMYPFFERKNEINLIN